MSARAWQARRARRDRPPFLVILDEFEGPARVLIDRRVDWARTRRLESLRRRQERRHPRPRPFPAGWRFMGATELPWSLPDADVLGDLLAASGGGWPINVSVPRRS